MLILSLSRCRLKEVTSTLEPPTPDCVFWHRLCVRWCFFLRGKWGLSELMWWIIHNFNSCCCWNVPLAVKGELGLYWPSFCTTDKCRKTTHHAHNYNRARVQLYTQTAPGFKYVTAGWKMNRWINVHQFAICCPSLHCVLWSLFSWWLMIIYIHNT